MKICDGWYEKVITYMRCPHCFRDIKIKDVFLFETNEVTCPICGNKFVLGEPEK